MILDRKISAVENELIEASEQLKGLVVEGGTVELEGPSVLDTVRAGVGSEAVSVAQW